MRFLDIPLKAILPQSITYRKNVKINICSKVGTPKGSVSEG